MRTKYFLFSQMFFHNFTTLFLQKNKVGMLARFHVTNFMQNNYDKNSKISFMKKRQNVKTTKNRLKKFILIKYSIYFTILRILAWYSRSKAPKFSIEELKRDFEKTLKQFFFFKNRFRLFTRTHQNLKYLFGLQVK